MNPQLKPNERRENHNRIVRGYTMAGVIEHTSPSHVARMVQYSEYLATAVLRHPEVRKRTVDGQTLGEIAKHALAALRQK